MRREFPGIPPFSLPSPTTHFPLTLTIYGLQRGSVFDFSIRFLLYSGKKNDFFHSLTLAFPFLCECVRPRSKLAGPNRARTATNCLMALLDVRPSVRSFCQQPAGRPTVVEEEVEGKVLNGINVPHTKRQRLLGSFIIRYIPLISGLDLVSEGRLPWFPAACVLHFFWRPLKRGWNLSR